MLLRLPGTYPAQADTQLLVDAVVASGCADGRDVLDVCTGGGAIALAAARAGAASVTAVDLSVRSVVTARLNSLLHRARVRVVRGDLFAPVSGRRFDVVLANPPYVPASTARLPRHTIERCWDAGPDGRALLDRLCDSVPCVLAPGGVLMLTQSSIADTGATLERLRAGGLSARVVARADEPFGPVMRERAAWLRERGILTEGQDTEELVVIEARAPQTALRGCPEVSGVDPSEEEEQEDERAA